MGTSPQTCRIKARDLLIGFPKGAGRMRKSRFGILVVSGLVLGLVSGSLALDPLETQVRIDHLEKRIDLLEKINIEKIIENEKLEKRLASVERYINLLKPQIIRQ